MSLRARRLGFTLAMQSAGTSGSTGEAAATTTRSPTFGPRSTVKKKVALILGFVGQGYSGFQKNRDVQTIEGDLENALHSAGMISEDNKDALKKVSWSKAARTDKGVSAVGQVASLKLALPRGDTPGSITVTMDQVQSDINAQLPPAIRVFGVVRATGGFSAKSACNQRRYEYLMPLAILRSCGTQEQTISEFSSLLEQYQGAHSFHNFTAVGRIGDSDVKRFIRSFTCEAATLAGATRPYLRLSVLGNSFVLHQIRKMVALAILTHNHDVPGNAIPLALTIGVRMNVAPAPGHALLLAGCDFSGYIKRHGPGPDGPISIHVEEQPIIAEAAENFKSDHVYPSIVEVEEAPISNGEESTMAQWLQMIREKHVPHFLSDFEEANPKSNASPAPS